MEGTQGRLFRAAICSNEPKKLHAVYHDMQSLLLVKHENLILTLTLIPNERDSPKPAYYCYVITKIVPPASVKGFVNPYVLVEKTNDKRDRCNPSVPYPPEEARWFFCCISSITRYTTR